MMDLEIADYERTVRSLHDAVAERDAKVQTLHEEIQCKEQQQASLQKLLGIVLFHALQQSCSCMFSLCDVHVHMLCIYICTYTYAQCSKCMLGPGLCPFCYKPVLCQKS